MSSFEHSPSVHSSKLEALKAQVVVNEEMLADAQDKIESDPLLSEDVVTQKILENGFVAKDGTQLDPEAFLAFRLQTIRDDQETRHLLVDADKTTPGHVVPYPLDKAA